MTYIVFEYQGFKGVENNCGWKMLPYTFSHIKIFDQTEFSVSVFVALPDLNQE